VRCCSSGLPLSAQTPTVTPNARQVEIERLNKLAEAEKDPEQQRKLWQKSWELRQQQYREDVVRFHEEWNKESDPQKTREIGEDLVRAAIDSDQPQVVLEVATDGKMAEKEIKIPEKDATTLPLRIVKSFEPEPYPYEDDAAWVVRRMTHDRLELWLPHHGGLFDAKGKIVNEARPPRRDGFGRHWYGAFLR
jgi:hypothetical protein